MNFTILRFDSIDSTNIEALKQARLGADEGLTVIARRQTAGRGRQARTWASPEDAGLYLSVVLRPRVEARYLPLITLSVAVAVFDSLKDLGLEPDIKWPNDVLVNDKKICGILAETAETNLGLAVIAGIGINLRSDNFPPELVETATSIESELGRPATSSKLESKVLRFLDHWYERLTDPDGPKLVVGEWSKRSTYAAGKRVRVMISSDVIVGVTNGLEPDGALRVLLENGMLHIVHAGDVERLRSTE